MKKESPVAINIPETVLASISDELSSNISWIKMMYVHYMKWISFSDESNKGGNKQEERESATGPKFRVSCHR